MVSNHASSVQHIFVLLWYLGHPVNEMRKVEFCLLPLMVTSYKGQEALNFPRVSSDERMEREEECGEHVGGGEHTYLTSTVKDGDASKIIPKRK